MVKGKMCNEFEVSNVSHFARGRETDTYIFIFDIKNIKVFFGEYQFRYFGFSAVNFAVFHWSAPQNYCDKPSILWNIRELNNNSFFLIPIDYDLWHDMSQLDCFCYNNRLTLTPWCRIMLVFGRLYF